GARRAEPASAHSPAGRPRTGPFRSRVSCGHMARVTVFGAGAMGTAVAMHLARAGNETVLWASEFDRQVLPDLVERRRHPALPEHLPEPLRVLGADELEAAAE